MLEEILDFYSLIFTSYHSNQAILLVAVGHFASCFFYGKQVRIRILRWHNQMVAIKGTARHCAIDVIVSDPAQLTFNSGSYSCVT